MPYLEPIPTSTDIWDETWQFTNTAVSLSDVSKPSNALTVHQQEEKPIQEPCKVDLHSGDAGQLPRPLEEFYISLIKSRESQEKGEMQPSTSTANPSVLEDVCPHPLTKHQENICTSEILVTQKPCNEVAASAVCGEQTYYQQSSYMSHPLLGFQKHHISKISATMALGPAARLATAGSLLGWVTEAGKI
ncbi:tudor domain-containing protein 5-like [Bombina bombina]|nr:tudor domain-containing protein 5-like [Bombina bombina]